MRIFALTVALMLAHPVTAFEPETNGVFSQRVISIVEQVTAPETVLDQPGGARTSLADFKGKVSVVTLWATWCHVCEIEMPIVDRLATENANDKIAYLPVSVDESPALALVEKHYKTHNFKNLPILIDRHHALAGRVGLRGTPTTIIVDKFSQVVAAFEGQAPWHDAETIEYLDALASAASAEQSREILAVLN